MACAYISLGSNLVDDAGTEPATQLDHAIDSLSLHPDINVVATSNRYKTRAIGPGLQPDLTTALI